MASTFAVSRNHLIFGVCLPFAVLLGYLLADINDPVAKVFVMVAIVGICFPLLMRWYHLVLIFFWSTTALFTFLPGRPMFWSVFSVIGLFFAVLNRSVNPKHKFAHVPTLTTPLVALAIVIIVIAAMTGGIGLQSMGATSGGGRHYFFLATAIMGFFALSSRTIAPKHAYWFLALFFLPGLTSIFSQMALWVGPGANFIYAFFPTEVLTDAYSMAQIGNFADTRQGGLTSASLCFFCWMLGSYGIKGVFDLLKPWRLLFFLVGIALGFFGGFRSHLILVSLIFGILFCLEKLWRTRVTVILAMMALFSTLFLIGFADKLPATIQRSLSFLPLDIDPMIKAQADSSSQWRIDLWQSVMHEVPIYFFKGKGYQYSGADMYMAQFNTQLFGQVASAEQAAVTGDYHNGPISLLIPFGVYGLVAFLWLIVAGLFHLYRCYKDGLPELKTINAFLLAYFAARSIFFFSIFGAVSYELYTFTGILGLSVALNVKKKESPEPLPEGELAVQT